MTTLAYKLILTDGSELRTDPAETDVYLGHCPTDLEMQDAALKAFGSTCAGEGMLRVIAGGRRRGVVVDKIMLVDVEITR